jgi:hypothetical protein
MCKTEQNAVWNCQFLMAFLDTIINNLSKTVFSAVAHTNFKFDLFTFIPVR